MVQSNPNKIPQPSKDDMMRILDIAWKSVLGRVDVEDRFKALWATNNFDRSEDFLVSQKIMDLVGTELIEYRKRLMENESPNTLKQLLSKITPPKGVRRKGEGNKQWGEGIEMFDCEGDVMEDEEMMLKKKSRTRKKKILITLRCQMCRNQKEVQFLTVHRRSTN